MEALKIKREVSGVEYEFELTRDEMWKAYAETQRELNKEDILSTIAKLSDEEVKGIYGVSRQIFESLAPEMAELYEDYQTRHWPNNYEKDTAIDEVIAEYLEEAEEE